MIKFFRHIRQSLIMKNQTGKYLKYAIGEIILVVIGILIALQINNWNNNRLNAKREANYIKNIERDLNNQISAIQAQIDFEAKIADNCLLALQPYNETNQLRIDTTFAIVITSISARRTFNNPNPSYIELISTGNIELLKNETFKNNLINYYEELERIENVIDGNNSSFIDQEFIPAMNKLGVVNTSRVWEDLFRGYSRTFSSPNPLNAKNMERLIKISSKLLKNEENELFFINHLASRETYAKIHILLLTEFKIQTKELLKAIENY